MQKNWRPQNMLGLCFSTWEVLKLSEFYSVEFFIFIVFIYLFIFFILFITARDIIVFAINFCIYSLRFFIVEFLLLINVPTSNSWWVVEVNVSWDNSGEKITRVIEVLYRVHVITEDTIFRIYIAFNKLWMHMFQLLPCVVANRYRRKLYIWAASELQRRNYTWRWKTGYVGY
jgi:hypothetical protein